MEHIVHPGAYVKYASDQVNEKIKQRSKFMAISFKFRPRLGFVHITSTGDVTFQDESSCLENIIADPAHQPGTNLLIDNRKKNPVDNAEQVRMIAHSYNKNQIQLGQIQIAIVVSSPVNYGMARMFSILTEDSSLESRIFYRYIEAHNWLSRAARIRQQRDSVSG